MQLMPFRSMFGVGIHPYGRTYVFAGTALETDFFYVTYLPVIPIRSQLVTEWSHEKLPTPLNARSIVAAYLLWWGSIVALFAGLGALRSFETSPIWWVWALVAAAAGAGATWAARRSWQLSDAEEWRRVVYARETEQPFDPALLPYRTAINLRDRLQAAVDDAARRLQPDGYRGSVTDGDGWLAVSLAPGVDDVGFLRAALTLAHVETGLRGRAERRRFAEARDAIWRKLRPQLSEVDRQLDRAPTALHPAGRRTGSSDDAERAGTDED